ncbi:AMP-binding protein [Nannocystaceae bacterium ST9]
MAKPKPPNQKSPLRSGLRRLRASVQNAREIVEFGRLGDPWGSPHEVVHADRHYSLRRYASVHTASAIEPDATRVRAPLLLVPPLMVTSEVYDVASDVSAVAALTGAGLDVWLVDFGAPERIAGGLERTLDDHVLAVDDAVTRVARATGRAVHLIGYSQGGMFCYQAAGYRRGQDIASLITFGSPVDIHRNLPAVGADLGARVIGLARRAVARPLGQVEGLPGFLTSTGFKLLSLRKELAQITDFLGKLHDREALVKRESRRRFLAGEGFVAWPGPALRTFVDEFIVANRMSSGGFVIAGRTVTLAELRMPILYFYGENDEIARAPSVRAIREAAPLAESFEIALPAGHFGLVVGSTAMTRTWPTVAQWVRWREQAGPRPSALASVDDEPRESWDEVESFEVDADFEPFIDVVGGLIGGVVDRIEQAADAYGESFDDIRYQLPRLRTLEQMQPDTRISLGRELASKAAKHPERTFFLWQGRAFTLAEADRRVDAIVRGLIDRGLRVGDRVGVLMAGRPSALSLIAAINRLGAVAVLFEPEGSVAELQPTIAESELAALICDPRHVAIGLAIWKGERALLVLGAGPRPLPEGVFDMEVIDPAKVELPAWYAPDPGRARDLALELVTLRSRGRINNARWAVSAYGAAAACRLSSRDTVLCVLPLHHAAGLLVAAGGALVGSSRLALATPANASTIELDPHEFWAAVRHNGASVVFYAGEMCRPLVAGPPLPAERNHPLRLLAGSGMRVDLWKRLVDRLGPIAIREFYASTEANLVLANIDGNPGALGRPLPGSAELAIVAYDFDTGDFVRDAQGFARRCRSDEAGLLIARVEDARSDRVRHDVFAKGDRWFVTRDIVRRDAGGETWYVDRTSQLIRGPHGWISARAIEDALYAVPGVQLAVVYGLETEPGAPATIVATIVGEPDLDWLASAVAGLRLEQRPRFVRLRERIAMTAGFRPLDAPLAEQGIDPGDPATLHWDGKRYVSLVGQP